MSCEESAAISYLCCNVAIYMFIIYVKLHNCYNPTVCIGNHFPFCPVGALYPSETYWNVLYHRILM